ncbi:patatin-like phospholipase family protein [Dyadobacter bucti]|uniref:patatin-like phospholipase family protein n=1 Tax=Dyadobacter bucti TaxID=2572203 RepID=UPI001109F653|nr:patatin-like phospholipase family protein [Dyadobacter bucti]
MNKVKHAFCFPGGGFKGATQVGFLKAAIEHNIHADIISGTSVGTLVGAFAAMRKYNLLFDLWDHVGKTNGSIITKTYLAELRDGGVYPNIDQIKDILTNGIGFKDKIGLITKKGQQKFIQKVIENGKSIDKIMDNSPLFDLLTQHVFKKDFQADFHFTLVSLYDGKLYKVNQNSFADDHNLRLGMLASTAMPGVWAPIPWIRLADGTFIRDAVDGGLRMSSPLPLIMSKLTKGNPWKVYTPNANSIYQSINDQKKNLVTQAASAIDILLNEGLQRDIKMTEKINEWALKYPEWAEKEGIVYAELFNIEVPLNERGESLLGRTLDPRAEWIEKRIQIGYESATKIFQNLSTQAA